jgi:RNA polymerase sigma-70 factor (TIGR02943 family)
VRAEPNDTTAMPTTQSAPLDPEEWVDRYGDYLYRFALLRLKEPASAEDAVQDTFLAAIQGLDRFDGRMEIKFWLKGILKHKIVDQVRRAVREQPTEEVNDPELLDSMLFKLSGVPTMHPQPWQFEPHRVFENNEFWSIFQSCMSKLNGRLQQAFALKMLEGLSTEEVCKVLAVEPNNLWVIMHRARGQLKACLEKNWTGKR